MSPGARGQVHIECRAALHLVDLIVVEVEARLDRQHHPLLEDPRRPQLGDARLIDSLDSAGVAADVVGVQPDEMAEAAGHEELGNLHTNAAVSSRRPQSEVIRAIMMEDSPCCCMTT